MRISTRGYNAASLDSTWRACHIAKADSREAITIRCGSFPAVILRHSAGAATNKKNRIDGIIQV
jgi:hypothetical protein